MNKLIHIYIVLISVLVFFSNCDNKSTESYTPFIQPYANIPAKQICLENNVKKRISVGSYYNDANKGNNKDTIASISFDRKGNILSIELPHKGIIEYLYKDSLLIEKREYNASGLYNTEKYSYSANIRIDSIYDDRHLYLWTKNYMDQLKRDTAIYRYSETTDWNIEGKESIVYDEYGFKEHVWEYTNGYRNAEKRINNDLYKDTIQSYYGDDNKEGETKIILYNNLKLQTEFKIENSGIEEHNIFYKTEYSKNGLTVKDTYYNKKDEPIYVLNYTYEYFDENQ